MSIPVHKVYIGLGSNLDEPEKQIQSAVEALRVLPKSRYIKDSGIYLSKPQLAPGDDDPQPDYYNAVALLETVLQPLILLDHLQAIEQDHGRVRTGQWRPRTLDLDILLYGELQMDTDRLQIPHPCMCEREFVLYPLQRVTDEMDIPGRGKLTDCIQKCSQNGLQYIGSIGGVK